MRTEKALAICMGILIIVSALTYSYFRIEDIKDTLEECKADGYYGIRFKDKPLTTQVECANLNDGESKHG